MLQSSSALCSLRMPMVPAINRGLRIHGGVTRPTNSRTWSSLTNDTNAGTWMPDCDARSRIASLSRKKRVCDSPMPGTRRCSRTAAAFSRSKSSSGTIRSIRRERARWLMPSSVSLASHCLSVSGM